jgi:catechol 2,3-dioxygenase-like lactoylglutathione lyase family enzyme
LQITLGKVLVFAPDLNVADEFYGETLGLKRAESGDQFRAFSGADFDMIIFKCDSPATPDEYSKQAGSTICFSVPDLAQAMVELGSKGVRFLHSEPQSGPNLRYVAFVDPFGTVHELIEERR